VQKFYTHKQFYLIWFDNLANPELLSLADISKNKKLAKIGGVKEGVLRKAGYRPDGSLRDTVIYGIIDDEWAAKKEKLLQLIMESENR